MSSSSQWFGNSEIAVALIQKCASSSIRDAVKADYGAIQLDEVIHVPRRLCWVRDPIDRLVSAFSYFHYTPYLPASITGRWQTFVDYTLTHDDPHWTPQVDLLTHDGVLLPNEVYWLKDLQATWPFLGLLPWIRGVKHVEVDTTYRRDELDAKYAGDYELCRCVAT